MPGGSLMAGRSSSQPLQAPKVLKADLALDWHNAVARGIPFDAAGGYTAIRQVQALVQEVDRLSRRLAQAEAELAPVDRLRAQLLAERRRLERSEDQTRVLEAKWDRIEGRVGSLEEAEAEACRNAQYCNERCVALECECAALAAHDVVTRGELLQAQERERALERKLIDQGIALAEAETAQLRACCEVGDARLEAHQLERDAAHAAQIQMHLEAHVSDERTRGGILRSELGAFESEYRALEADHRFQGEQLTDEVERSARLLSRNENLESDLYAAKQAARAAATTLEAAASAEAAAAAAPPAEEVLPPTIALAPPTPAYRGGNGGGDRGLTTAETALSPSRARREGERTLAGATLAGAERSLAPLTRRDYPRSARSRTLRAGILRGELSGGTGGGAAAADYAIGCSLPRLAAAS